MNKHEIEALRRLAKSWVFNRAQYETLSNEACLGACEIDINNFLDSLPAPDDGLREGLEGLVKELEFEEEQLQKAGDCVCGKRTTDLIVDIKELLAKTPDGWKPIADAPRDGREVIGWFIDSDGEEFIKWDKSKKLWKNRYGGYWGQGCFSFYREKPAPPREGKE